MTTNHTNKGDTGMTRGTNEYLKLAERPRLEHPGNPTCEACAVEVIWEDDWLCPSCGTTWSAENLEAGADDAQLFEEWSGETLTGPTCPNEYAWRIPTGAKPEERDRLVQKFIEVSS